MTLTSKYYIQTVFNNPANQDEQVQFDYSSVKPIRDSIQNSLHPPTFSYTPVDLDRDGTVDQFNITMRIKKPVNSAGSYLALNQLNLLMEFQCELSSVLQMSMQGVASIDIDAYATDKLSVNKIKTQGDLLLAQPNAMAHTHDQRDIYMDNFFDTLQTNSMHEWQQKYHTSRNETLKYDYRSSVQYG